MLPIITLIGHVNVGKSTLFNKFTCTKNALVANFPGLTIDRQYGLVKYDNHEFIIVDTGVVCLKNILKKHINNQSRIAIKEADIILFVVDAKSSIMSNDLEIINYIRHKNKSIIIVINKIDGINIDNKINDLYYLGIKDIVPIAACYGRGINKLLKKIILFINKKKLEQEKNYYSKLLLNNDNTALVKITNKSKEKINVESLPMKLVIVGRPNVGKSTLINFITGEDRVVVDQIPGTTRDSIYVPTINKKGKYVLIDTAGIRKRSKIINFVDKLFTIKTIESIQCANVVLLLMDVKEGIFSQDLSILNNILTIGKPIVIAINKCDTLSNQKLKEIKNMLNKQFQFLHFIKIHFISAKYGININNLLKSINKTYSCSNTRINSALLNRVMYAATSKHLPPKIHKNQIKLKYAHIGSYNPLIIVIHGNLVDKLPLSYKRYLINYFYNSLNIIGIPVNIKFNKIHNPYVTKI